jgi:hypothetical protein
VGSATWSMRLRRADGSWYEIMDARVLNYNGGRMGETYSGMEERELQGQPRTVPYFSWHTHSDNKNDRGGVLHLWDPNDVGGEHDPGDYVMTSCGLGCFDLRAGQGP